MNEANSRIDGGGGVPRRSEITSGSGMIKGVKRISGSKVVSASTFVGRGVWMHDEAGVLQSHLVLPVLGHRCITRGWYAYSRSTWTWEMNCGSSRRGRSWC